MLSHIVIFWTDSANPNAVEELVAGANKYLPAVPQVRNFHCGLMVPSERQVVDQSYQVALNVTFDSKADEAAYQVHPTHLDFVNNCKHLWSKVVIYDFE